MKKRNITTTLFILMTFNMLTLALPQVQAQEQSQQQDKTGTNPVNFTKDIRPSFGIGADRPVDYSVEVGYKIVGF